MSSFRRNRPRFTTQGTDSRRNSAASVYNPVGLFSQEGILHNPRQRFEIVLGLSEQDRKTTSSTNYQTKALRSSKLATLKMATKTIKSRYVSKAISFYTFKLAVVRIAILKGLLSKVLDSLSFFFFLSLRVHWQFRGHNFLYSWRLALLSVQEAY